jgi:hypothetical protein
MTRLSSNPYIVGNPIKAREMFFGREDDFHFVLRKIGPGTNQIVVLTGERRSGKTSILFQILGGRLGSSFLPVLLDMQMLAGIKDDRAFYAAIARNGYAALGMDTDNGSTDGRAGPGTLLEDFLKTAVEREPGKTILFLFDEYELIEQKIKEGSLGDSALQYLAWALESEYPVSFVFTGSTNLEDRNHEIWRALLGKSVYRKISYLSHADTLRLITEPLDSLVTWPPEVVESIYRLSGGQPFFTQVICQNMVDLLIDEDRADPRPADLERVVSEIIANPLPQMIYFWNSFGAMDRLMLSALAADAEDPAAGRDPRQILESIRQKRIVLPFDREKASILLETAYHRELLEKDEGGRYRFRMDIYRHWIRREHSIWQAMKEADLGLRPESRPRLLLPLGAVAVLVAAALTLSLATGWFGVGQGRGRGNGPDFVENITFKSNRGPFILTIDSSDAIDSAISKYSERWVVVSSLAAGLHSFTAKARDGAVVTLPNSLVSPSSKDFFFAFAEHDDALKTAPPAAVQTEGEGIFAIESTPPGAQVYDGNDYRGVTPANLSMAPGVHLINVMLEGYSPYSFMADIVKGEVTRKAVTLEKGKAILAFAIPEAGSIYIDGAFLTKLPSSSKMVVAPGKHLMRIELQNDKVVRELQVDLAAGSLRTIEKDMR